MAYAPPTTSAEIARTRCLLSLLLALLGFHAPQTTFTRAALPTKPNQQAGQPRLTPSASVPLRSGDADSPYRQLAPGVLREVPAENSVHDTYSRHDIVELLKLNPAYDWAKNIRFEHAIWSLDIAYKPVRFISVDVPNASGRVERKTVWYLVYRVKNPTSQSVPFYPWLVLESRDPKVAKAYPDRLIPAAIQAIVAREDRHRPLATTVSISGDVPAGKEVWGVATWTDIEPNIDRFSIYISGLTNAYRWRDDPNNGRVFLRKTLELNFWRPGDEFFTHETEIRPGGPEEVDHRWVYR